MRGKLYAKLRHITSHTCRSVICNQKPLHANHALVREKVVLMGGVGRMCKRYSKLTTFMKNVENISDTLQYSVGLFNRLS